MSKAKRPRDPKVRADLWQYALKDVEMGHAVGPFLVQRRRARFRGTDRGIPTERFGVEQRGKTRGIDNAAPGSGSELTAATDPSAT